MKRRDFLTLAGSAGVAGLLSPGRLFAQQATKPLPRIIVLSDGLPDDQRLALIQGFADHGLVDGKYAAIDYLAAATTADVPAMAAQAVARKPDLIVTYSPGAAMAVKGLTSTIPVLFTGVPDPVAIGLVPTYAEPGGNVTGLMSAGPDFMSRQMQLVHEVLPAISRIAIFGWPADPPYAVLLAEVRNAAKAQNVDMNLFEAKQGDDLAGLFDSAVKAKAQAIYCVDAAYLTTLPTVAVLADLALRYKLPSFGPADAARHGMMIGYGANPSVSARRTGAYAATILAGAKPADLPVQGPTVFQLVVNLRTATALGVTIPEPVVMRATEVIRVGR